MRIPITLLLAILSLTARAQSTLKDSLLAELQKSKDDTNKVKLYDQLIYDENYFFENEPEKLDEKLGYAQNMLLLSQRLGYKIGIAKGYNSIGSVYRYQGAPPNKALQQFYYANEIFKEIGDQRMVAGTLYNAGLVFTDHNDRKRADEKFLEAKKILQDIGDSSLFTAAVLQRTGITYYYRKDYAQSLTDLFTSIHLFKKNGWKKELPILYGQAAVTLIEQKKYDEALSYANKALDLSREQSNPEAEKAANKILRFLSKKRR